MRLDIQPNIKHMLASPGAMLVNLLDGLGPQRFQEREVSLLLWRKGAGNPEEAQGMTKLLKDLPGKRSRFMRTTFAVELSSEDGCAGYANWIQIRIFKE
jgi:hypothetical protein